MNSLLTGGRILAGRNAPVIVLQKCGFFNPAQSANFMPHGVVTVDANEQESVQQMLKNWNRAEMMYYGPDRDFENYPPYRQKTHSLPYRMFCIPDGLFEKFYDKTGVTGPYLFFGLLGVSLCKFELVVFDPHLFEAFVFYVAFLPSMTYLLGDKFRYWMLQTNYQYELETVTRPMTAALQQIKLANDRFKRKIWQQEYRKLYYQAQKENVALQLEALYRSRLLQVNREVKRRLNYMSDRLSAESRMQNEHRLSWIVDSVKKALAAQDEKETMRQCLTDLKGLATATAK